MAKITPEPEHEQDLIDLKIELLRQYRQSPYKLSLKPSHKPNNQGYVQPSPDEIRETFGNYTTTQVAEMLGIDPRTVRRWLEDADAPGHRTITYSAWRLFLIITGKIPAI